jgi:chaperonin GroEL (HSP60 family)
MMSDKLREAAQAAGDAKDILFLREMSVHDKVYLRLEDAINAIKAALEEPKTEYICKCGLRVVPHQCKTNKEF